MEGGRGVACLGKCDSPAGPGGKATANVAHSPPKACRQEFNAGANIWTAQQEREEEGMVG